VLNTLRKRTFAHPWAIVRRNLLNCSKHTEEANVRPALGDRSLPRQAHKDARLSPAHAAPLAQVRMFTQHWAIVRPRGELLHVTYLGHFPPYFPSLSPTPQNLPPRRPLSHRVRTPQPTTKHHQSTTTPPTPTTTLHYRPLFLPHCPIFRSPLMSLHSPPTFITPTTPTPFGHFFFILTTALCYSRV
jgi:hypothetical protein